MLSAANMDVCARLAVSNERFNFVQQDDHRALGRQFRDGLLEKLSDLFLAPPKR